MHKVGSVMLIVLVVLAVCLPVITQGEEPLPYQLKMDAVVKGEWLYAAMNKGDRKVLQVYSIKEEAEPILMINYQLGGEPIELEFLDDNNLCVVNGTHLLIIDVSDPLNPKSVSKLEISKSFLKGPQAIAIKDKTGYLACGQEVVKVIDLENPSEPKVVFTVNPKGFARDLFIEGDRMYLGAERGIWVLDISDPRNPKTLGYVDTFIVTWQIVAKDGYVFVGGGNVKWQVVDARNQAEPKVIYDLISFNGYYFGNSFDMDLASWEGRDYVFIANGEGGFWIVDWQAKEKPVIIGATWRPIAGGTHWYEEISGYRIKDMYGVCLSHKDGALKRSLGYLLLDDGIWSVDLAKIPYVEYTGESYPKTIK